MKELDRSMLRHFDIHEAISEQGNGLVIYVRRYDQWARATISREAIEDTRRPELLIVDTLHELASILRGRPITDHDPGDEDRTP